MQSLTFQNNNTAMDRRLISQNQPKAASGDSFSHHAVCSAVRAWAASINNQDFVTGLIVEEWERRGGDVLDFPDDLSRRRQKLFRWLDGTSMSAQRNIQLLTPSILAVLPLEFRNWLLPEDSIMARLARLEKETSEAKIAVAMGAPKHQKLKELSEGIVEMFRVDPDLTLPLMTLVTSMLGVV
ncbi:toxin YdaT domain-containing protein [Kluyvera cryocrescens]|uniref:toxin YdaT domain-containing protein n=1 Tax=Kluyvera cryocrescens TaxID=580 RepID=UPI0039F4A044